MLSKRLLALAVAALVSTLYACGMANDATLGGRSVSALCASMGQAINSTGPVPAGCVKIEGSQIGQVPQTLTFSGITLTITGWTDKGGSGDEKVGFTFTSSGSVMYAVKASTRTFAGDSTTWVHPDGTSGPSANGISNITFCPNSSDAGTPGGGGGGGTGRNNPDAGSPGGGECPPDGLDDGSGNSDGGMAPPGPTNLVPGSTCTVNGNCASNTCTAGICAPSDEKEPCVTTSHCATDLTCVAGFCQVVIN